MGCPALGKRHQASLSALAELRNSFVHYKWTYVAVDSVDEQTARARSVLGEIEKTVAYLRRYDQTILLHGAKARLNRVAKHGHKLQPTGGI
jgi:hypothetical protein